MAASCEPQQPQLGLFKVLYASPVLCRLGFFVSRQMGQRKHIGNAPFGVTGSTFLCNPNETQSFGFSDCRCNGVAVNAVVLEVLEGHRQLAVFPAAVVGVLDLDTINYAACGKAENAMGGRFQHFNGLPCKLTGNLVSTDGSSVFVFPYARHRSCRLIAFAALGSRFTQPRLGLCLLSKISDAAVLTDRRKKKEVPKSFAGLVDQFAADQIEISLDLERQRIFRFLWSS